MATPSSLSIQDMNESGAKVVALIARLPTPPHFRTQRPSPVGMTVREYLDLLSAGDKATHACGCGWKGTASGDAGACPACGGVVTPQT